VIGRIWRSLAYRWRRWKRAGWVETCRRQGPLREAEVRLFAMLGTWMEGDVIEATVANALEQGCERIYFVDNCSPDDTVALAERAGAVYCGSYQTTVFRESDRTVLMNRLIREISKDEDDVPLWWLRLDADEFPHGPKGLTVREYLATLPPSVSTVGCLTLEHFPTTRPAYVPGLHPADLQPMAALRTARWCRAGHWKHPVLRWNPERDRAFDEGAHKVISDESTLREPARGIVVHHCPFREEAVTRRRLAQLMSERLSHLTEQETLQRQQMLGRVRVVDRVYAGEFEELRQPSVGFFPRRLQLKPWQELVPAQDRVFRRWNSQPPA
jgi:glycosyl transferase family 2